MAIRLQTNAIAKLWPLFTVCFATKINIPTILHYLQLVNLRLASSIVN